MSPRSRLRAAASVARLFPREELRLSATGQARLARLARAPRAIPAPRERRVAEDRQTIDRLRAQSVELCRRFELRCRSIDAEVDGVVEHYGICYEDGTIRIRLRHARTGRLLKESSLVDTLCHELAHLRHMNHGPRFRRLYQQILDVARERGFYRPGPAGDARPRQARLFGDDACGTPRPARRAPRSR